MKNGKDFSIKGFECGESEWNQPEDFCGEVMTVWATPLDGLSEGHIVRAVVSKAELVDTINPQSLKAFHRKQAIGVLSMTVREHENM